MDFAELTDPSDWGEFVDLREFDRLLRCTICYEYFTTAMDIQGCSHTFCSLCIRRYLQKNNQCPACSQHNVGASSLVNNRLVDELVNRFKIVRPALLKGLKQDPAESKSSKKQLQPPCKEIHLKQQDTDKPVHQDVYPAINNAAPMYRGKSDSCSVQNQGKGDQVLPVAAGNYERVPCPICQEMTPANFINTHLDLCLKGPPPTPKKATQPLHAPTHVPATPSAMEKRRPMAKVVYSMLKDNDLRIIMSKLGLSTDGNRQIRIRRHQDFVTLYNSSCDALHPLSEKEIVLQVESEERARMQGYNDPRGPRLGRGSSKEEIAQFQKMHLSLHATEFEKLKERAKRTRTTAGKLQDDKLEPQEPMNTLKSASETEDEINENETNDIDYHLPKSLENGSNIGSMIPSPDFNEDSPGPRKRRALARNARNTQEPPSSYDSDFKDKGVESLESV